MLNLTEKIKIKAFLSDEIMFNAVTKVLRESFLKSSGTSDVQTLAAERIAINRLASGCKELKTYSNQVENEIKDKVQIGL